MPPKTTRTLASEAVPPSTLKPLRLRETADRPSPANAAAALRPIRPTHTTGATSHAQHHTPLKAQS